MSTHHENVIIGHDEVITKEGPEHKQLFTFNYLTAGSCTQKDSKCGFILKSSVRDGHWTVVLCKDSEEYTDTGLHYHDIISAHEMYRYLVLSGTTADGKTVTAAGWWEWDLHLPDVSDWKFEATYIAYNRSDYMVAKQH